MSRTDQPPADNGVAGPDIVAICTVDLAERRADYKAMLLSLPQDVQLVTVFRGPQEPDDGILELMPSKSAVLRVPSAPLSVSRNLGLDEIVSWDLDPSAVICFPDDDCTWIDSTADAIRAAFSDDAVSPVIGRYRPADAGFNESRYPNDHCTLTPRLVLSRCASIVTSTRVGTALALRFDERLGVGAMYPSAEDTDFAQRALAQGGVALYDPSIVCLHRYELVPDPKRKIIVGFMVARHTWRFPQLAPHILTFWTRRLLRGPERLRLIPLVFKGLFNLPRPRS